ncbi:MAG: hypothetical protein GY913_29985 [Proteobacteria bacterium]|nr:hypothetical protein [Pseudomonadota bacterium]MCP4921147.1 hypothetical protein [Pseudomonadota bacterium]
MWFFIAAAWADEPLEDHGRRLLERGEHAAAMVQLQGAECADSTCTAELTEAADGAVRSALVGDAWDVLALSVGIEADRAGFPYSDQVAEELKAARHEAVVELAARNQVSGLLNDRERLGLSEESVVEVSRALAALPEDPVTLERRLLESRPTDALYGDTVALLDSWFLHAVGERVGAGTGSDVPLEFTVPVRVDVGRCAMLQPWDQDRTPKDRTDVEVRLSGRCSTQKSESRAMDDELGVEVTKVAVSRSIGGTLIARWDGGSETSPITVRHVSTTIAYQTSSEQVVLDVPAAEAASLEGAWESVDKTSRRLASLAADERAERFLTEARVAADEGSLGPAVDLAAYAWLLRGGEDEVAFIADHVDAEASWVRSVLQGQQVERPTGPLARVPELPSAELVRDADGRLAGPGLEELSWFERRK